MKSLIDLTRRGLVMLLFHKRIDVREEDIFSELHHFLLRKKSIFPNLGAPCERCGQITQAKICVSCSSSIVGTLKQEEKDRAWFNQIQRNHVRASTYHYK